MIKKIKIELIIIGIIFLNLFISSNIDFGFNNFFKDFNYSLSNIYLKKFFINLTELGDSLWFFLISILGYFCFYFLKKNKLDEKNIYETSKNFFSFLFFSILITGILTQIIKHIVGRPRPNYALESGGIGLDFFNFESSFHSFPSGHTSTIFVVALVFSILTPKIKYFYFLCASLIAFSRIVVGAHYFTDVVAGIVVAFIGFKLTLHLFNKINKPKSIYKINKLNNNYFLLSLVVFCILIIFVTVGDTIDIYISGLFYQGNQNFFLQSFYIITIIARKIILPIIVLYLLIFPIISFFIPLKTIYYKHSFTINEIFLIFFSLFFNLLIVVNLLLKNLWGRARPNEILQLGGKEIYTPWYQFSDACEKNCSFVSGDASVGFSLIILYFITKNINYLWLSLLMGFFIGLIRIMEGGHFFSDVLLSGFLIYALSALYFYFYKKNFY